MVRRVLLPHRLLLLIPSSFFLDAMISQRRMVYTQNGWASNMTAYRWAYRPAFNPTNSQIQKVLLAAHDDILAHRTKRVVCDSFAHSHTSPILVARFQHLRFVRLRAGLEFSSTSPHEHVAPWSSRPSLKGKMHAARPYMPCFLIAVLLLPDSGLSSRLRFIEGIPAIAFQFH